MEILLIDTTICIGTEFTLVPFYFNTPPVQNGYVNPINFTWDNGNIDPFRIINAAGAYTATVSNQCYSKSATSNIDLKPCDIEVPNIINLSSSVGNNLFFVKYNGLAEFNCLIFNRWGNLIYEYSDPAGTWDGKTEDGKLVSEGTYFYKINARFDGLEEGFVKHGFVVVKY
jgi:gliding motility-associated-like protein